MNTPKHRPFVRRLSVALACVMACLTVNFWPAPTAQALTREELDAQLNAYQQKLEQDKADLAKLKQDTANAKKRKQNLENQVATIKSQIDVLAQTIATVQADIGNTQLEIADKEVEIANRETDIYNRREDFKARMAAMQELHDAGAMAMLSSVTNLYQLLTFTEVLQDIANKDTQILEELRDAKAALEQAKIELEEKTVQLAAQEADLAVQKEAAIAKQGELETALVKAGKDLKDAQDAQAAAQAVLDSDTINYEAIQKQMEDLISSGQASNEDLTLNTGFICPLRSYSRISSNFGWRSSGFHYGQDWAADEGTPIYAAAGGKVIYAGWNNGGYGNYVLIYHGKVGDKTYSTLYAHMYQRPDVVTGQTVVQGQKIGGVGTTGRSSGNHLHLELWQNSSTANTVGNKAERIDPRKHIPLK